MPGQFEEEIARQGYAFVPAVDMEAVLRRRAALDDWMEFSSSWHALPVDEYMADHGRYRRRRHAVFAVNAAGSVSRLPQQPHFQSLAYNRLHGGIERWFEPIPAAFADGSSLAAILGFCTDLFGRLGGKGAWHVEVHQFRIEALPGGEASPTPEGMHRDGVDYVLVLLVHRHNIDSGTTMIGTAADGFCSSFTLTRPFDAALVDDHRVFHGVTPVQPINANEPAYRDVLVVTYRRS